MSEPEPTATKNTIRIQNDVPPEVWNRTGTKLLPKLRSGSELTVGINIRVCVDGTVANNLQSDIKQVLEDPGITDRVEIGVEQIS